MAVVLACACDAPSEPDAGPRDAQPRDAGDATTERDGGPALDAGRDGGRDAGSRDGGPEDPGWEPLPGWDGDCTILHARHPERIPGLTWRACVRDGVEVPNCVHSGYDTAYYSGPLHAYDDGGTRYFFLRAGVDVHHLDRIVRDDGVTVAAWLTPATGACGIEDEVAISDGEVVFSAFYFNWMDWTENRTEIFIAPVDAASSVEEPFVAIEPERIRLRSVEWLRLTPELLVYTYSPDGQTFAVSRADGTSVDVTEVLREVPQNLHVVDDHVLWVAWGSPTRLAHALFPGPSDYFRDVSPGDTKGFGTDGVDMAWLEGYDRQPGGRYARLELWTAPYTADMSTFAPRKVRDFPIRAGSRMGGGWFAIRLIDDGPQRVEVFSLRDGHRRVFVSPTGYVIEEPFYVTEDELAYNGGRSGGIVRVQIADIPIVDESGPGGP